jgi:AhpD family alkylhydroperoxidase
MDKINILLVDDKPAKLLSYQVILEELGENLIKANSAREALAELLRNEIAVVLTDVSMPEIDGFELAAMIREHPRFQRTAIIFVSAIHLTDPDRLRGYAAGAVDYLTVPFVPELMRAKVKVFAELFRKTMELERLNAELERRVEERTVELAQANAKIREIISLAVTVTARSDGCITVHADDALRHGATREEIAEALRVTSAVNAGVRRLKRAVAEQGCTPPLDHEVAPA